MLIDIKILRACLARRNCPFCKSGRLFFVMCWENLGEFSVARWETPDPGLEDGRVRPEKLPWTGAGPGSFGD